MNIDRSWMWRRLDSRGFLSDEFVEGVKEFLKFAYAHPRFVCDGQIKCLCSKCGNRRLFGQNDVHYHIEKNGFSPGYELWYAHGETMNMREEVGGSSKVPAEEGSHYRTMVMDALGPKVDFNAIHGEQPPNPEARAFFDLLKDVDEPLWDGCKNHTKLSATAQLLNIKSKYNMSETCYDRLVSIIKTMLPEGEKLPDNLYKTKKQLVKLGLGYEKIDVCVNDYILYYKENKDHQECHVCCHPRYKPRKRGARKQVPFKKNWMNHKGIIKRKEALEYFRNKCIDGLVKVLRDLANSPYAPEDDVSGIADPFLHIRLLRLLHVLGQGDPDAMNDISCVYFVN